MAQNYNTIRYDKEFNVDSKAECDQLNLAHKTKTNKRQCPLSYAKCHQNRSVQLSYSLSKLGNF